MAKRVGLGEDLHRLEAGRPLILGGVRFEHDKGLAGHSDGDVVLHAVADALLGATGGGDIGDHFPDTDESIAGIDSAEILGSIVRGIQAAGFRVENVDIVISAEAPRLGEGKARIRTRIAELLGVDSEQVNVKAKSGEGIGAVGGGEAISCRAIAMVSTV